MHLISSGFILLLIATVNINADDACLDQFYLNLLDGNKILAKNVSTKDCSQINFEGNERLNSHLGSVRVEAEIHDKKHFLLNISFCEIKWNKAYIKVTELGNPNKHFCKIYSVANLVNFPITEVYDPCFHFNNYKSVNYELEFKAELKTDVLYKKIIFKAPPQDQFDNSVPLSKRAIFMSVDTSSNYGIILKIQTLPFFYNVTYYKVEVYREKDEKDILLDVRMIKAEQSKEISFEYITYNEEGHYFFKVSAVSDACPEEACVKSLSSKVYIKRKYPPLVIGIVGASFLIPFVLFIFHMWTRRTQSQDEIEEQKDRIFIVYNQTPEKHYAIVKTLEKTVKSLSNVQIVSNISESTHILYICGTHIFEPDPVTHKFLVIEANKAISDYEIFVVCFPYSTKEIPPYLKKSLRFDLMSDFGKFIHVFNCEVEYENNAHYVELSKKVKAAQIQTEPTKITLNMPIIIVTEQSDGSDTEPKEGDVLL